MRSWRKVLLFLLFTCLGGCNGASTDGDGDGDADGDSDADVDTSDADEEPVTPCPEEMILIDEGVDRPYCIDRFEYPGLEGHLPTVGVPWYQAREACVEFGKELCQEDVWVQACIGTPSDACEGDLDASGSRPDCVSDYGVFDLGGNVAEWTAQPSPNVSFVVRGGSGESGTYGCDVREEFPAELRRTDLGLRCCLLPRQVD